MLSLVLFILTYVVAGCIHELSHLLIATLLVRIQNKRQNKKHYKSSSFFNSNIHEENLYSIVFFRKIKISHLSIIHDAVVRHFGWILSVTVAILSTIFFILLKNHYEYTTSIPVLAGLWITAIEAIGSDLFTFFGSHQPGIFLCGNFGLILLNLTHEHLVRPILEKMITVTMMRGAQSGGVVTFLPNGSAGLKGSRSRVVNGKRTNLSKLIGSKMTRDLQFRKILSGGLLKTPRVYAGHTRFATSSVSSLPGTHPHQWTPSRTYVIWSGFLDGNFTCSSKNVEVFICHNGDFDFFTIKDKIYSVEEIQKWLPMVTHAPMPCSVDSAAVAGVMDVLRTQGSWYMSIRYAIVFAMDWTNLDEASRSQKAIQAVADVFERLFKECLGTSYKVSGDAWTAPNLRQRMKTIAESSSTLLTAINTNINKNSIESISQHISAHAAELEAFKAGIFNGSDLERGERFDDIDTRFITSVIDAFFDNDLLASTRFFFAHAKGSFGLCVTCSLDADRQLCLGARGQTISIALYPSVGMVLYGSEQAAVKAAIGLIPDNVDLGPAMRLDLDDLGGEVCLVDWGDALVGSESMNIQKQVQMQHETSIHAKKIVQKLNFCSIHGVSDTVKLICFQESMKSLYNLKKRMVCIQGNELVLPIPPTGDDIVGDDIHDTPRIIKNIQEASSVCNIML